VRFCSDDEAVLSESFNADVDIAAAKAESSCSRSASFGVQP
jgi:hypothetical protein